jgi:hypothetical protein
LHDEAGGEVVASRFAITATPIVEDAL